MEDQAFRLRQLVSQKLQTRYPSAVQIGVFGVSPGSGVTSIATALANFWADQGRAIRLLKAEHKPSEGGPQPGMVLDGSGPLGFHSASGRRAGLAATSTNSDVPWFPAEPPMVASNDNCRNSAPGKQAIGATGHWIVVDCGMLGERELQNHAADWVALILVTTADPLAIMEAYKLVKRLTKTYFARKLLLVVNRCESVDIGLEMGRRFQVACERFMGWTPWVTVVPLWKEQPAKGEVSSRGAAKGKLVLSQGGSVKSSDDGEGAALWERSVAQLANHIENIALQRVSGTSGEGWQPCGRSSVNVGNFHQKAEFAGWLSGGGQGNEIKAIQNG